MAYTKTTWVDNSEPPINAENLNKIEQGIYDATEGLAGKVDKVTGKGLSTNDYTDADKAKLTGIDMSTKQDTLVSGTNIKTINGSSLLGSGNIVIEGGGGGGTENIAAEYDNTSTYAVDDYCIYDGQLYRCTTAITTAEAWTAAHWTMATVGGELTDLKGDIPQNVSDLTNDADYQTGLQVQAALTAYKNVYRIDLPSFSSLPLTFSNSKITADHEIINSVLGTPSAQTGDWTLTPTAGSATLSGSISGSTTLTLYIAEVESLTVT